MVSYLQDDLWEKFISTDIRREITSKDDVETAIELFFNQENASEELKKKHQHLYEHIKLTKSFYLDNIQDKLFITTDELLDKFKDMGIPYSAGLNLSIREFMKEKKNHEVEIISRVIAALSQARGKEHFIIDVGDGKGYLSSRLNLEFKLKVLGVDCNSDNSREAVKRNQRLSKMWKTLVTKKARKNNIDIVQAEIEQLKLEDYKTTSKMIFANTNLTDLVASEFPDEASSDLCLVGLHTCGNLAPSSLKQFVRNENIKTICNVGCCYHLIFEEFEDDFFNDEARVMEEQDEPGFPMSAYLREKKYKLGRNARMLAAQCFERVIENKKLPDESLFYRALFEKVLQERWSQGADPKVFKLGRLKFTSFEDYLRKGCKKYDLNMDLTFEEIQELLERHDYERHLINISYFIRLLMAKVIETLIILDRYLFLLENETQDVFLVKIFDPVVSPRNFCLIGIKK